MSKNEPISSKKGQLSGGCAAAFFSIFLLAGLGFLFVICIRPAWKSLEARSWVEVPCVIQSSEVGSHRDSDGTTYSVKIRFKYWYDDVEYESDRYQFLKMSSSGRKGKAAIVKKYPPGAETVCFVDPDNPEDAVIYRGLPSMMWFILHPAKKSLSL